MRYRNGNKSPETDSTSKLKILIKKWRYRDGNKNPETKFN